MTLSEITALPELWGLFNGWTCHKDGPDEFVILSRGYFAETDCYVTPEEAWQHADARAPEPDVWLNVMDEFDNRVELESDCDGKPRASIVIHDARHIHCATVTSSTRSDALRRAVCAVKVFLNQREEANQ